MKITIPKSLADRPGLLGDVAAAVAEIRRSGEILVDDSLLEHYLASWLESQPGIEAAALYGFQNTLRLVIQSKVAGATAEITIELRAEPVIWKEYTHQLVFAYSMLTVDHKGKVTRTIKTIAAEALGLIAPCVGLIASFVIGKVAQGFAVAKIKDLVALDTEGITVDGGKAVVDLDVFSQTHRLLWYRSRLLDDHPRSARLLKLEDVSLGQLFALKGLSISRDGIRAQVETSEKGKEVIERASMALSGGAKIAKVAGGLASRLLGKRGDEG